MTRGHVQALGGSLVLALAHAAPAVSDVLALDLGVSFSPSVAADVDDDGRIIVEGPTPGDGLPSGIILLPPHPGGGELLLPCNADADPDLCFHELHVPMRLARSGRILGRIYFFESGGGGGQIPATWSEDGTGTQPLAGLPGTPNSGDGRVYHGNAGGLLVGMVYSASLVQTPVTWASPTALPVALDTGSVASGLGPFPARVNDAGQIVGSTTEASPRAATWLVPGHALAFLPMLPGGVRSHALAIDANGVIVGSSDDGSGTEIAVVWTPSESGWNVAPLPSPASTWECSQATAISDLGQIVGNCTNGTGEGRGVVWDERPNRYAVAAVLAPLAGDVESAAFDVNEERIGVGRSGPASSARAVLWTTPAPVPSLGPRGLAALALGLLVVAAASRPRARAR